MDVVNPATGEQEASYEEHTADDVDAALERATDAFGSWRDRPHGRRAAGPRGCLLPADGADRRASGLSGAGIGGFVNRKTVWVE